MSQGTVQKLRWVRPSKPEIQERALAAPVEAMPPAVRALERVGLPTAPYPHNQSALAEARFLLKALAEIEHGLLALYLYAAYSCTNFLAVRKIVQIAKEEMGHLLCVQNLLLTVGANPYFGREGFPTEPDDDEIFPFALILEPLTLESLAKYVTTESPPLENIADPDLRRRVAPIAELANQAAQETINHVGSIFIALYWLLKKDDSAPSDAEWKDYPTDYVLSIHRDRLGRQDWHVKDEEFASAAEIRDYQASDSEGWGGSDDPRDPILVRRVLDEEGASVDRDHLLETLHLIAEQGEGWEIPEQDGQNPGQSPSHFLRFLETFEDFERIIKDGGSLPVIETPTRPTTEISDDAPENAITNPEANLWGKLFNTRYRALLLQLSLIMATPRSESGDSPLNRGSLIDRVIFLEMTSTIRPLATELVKMRRQGVKSDGPTTKMAGPPFELPNDALPDLSNCSRSQAVAAIRSALKAALIETQDLAGRIYELPDDLLDEPADRLLLQGIGDQDADLLEALG